jgi:hypothetical protein
MAKYAAGRRVVGVEIDVALAKPAKAVRSWFCEP